MHIPDRASGSAAPAAEPDDVGPPDWFAAVALPEDAPEATESPAPDGRDDSAAPDLADVPGLRSASALPTGRRRRRSALAPDDEAPPVEEAAPRPRRERAPRSERGERRERAELGAHSEHDEDSGPGGRAGRPGGRRRRSDRAERGERSSDTSSRRTEEQADPAGRARDICLRLLTGSPRTRKQLADALRKREIPDDVAEEVLSRYEEVGLIDDAAFAAAWVDARHGRRGLARRALAQELRTRGVAGDLVEEALARVGSDDEAEAARALVDRKLRTTRSLEPQARTRRLVGMLARRGYSEGLAFRVVREALGEESEGLGEDW
ncbi:regulatory protein RecX [Streptomyces sp. NRRL B-24484]|uniref:regulatory protein RecX n=1 Tax=Streptomyces sp. NRRL B-24484 TaxID=1463833 RepID=UPI000998D3E3|nr:regulatory protein RecX [Streptomyces sp. NRRL B-24484]